MAETSATPVRTITLRDLQLGQVALTPEQREQMAKAVPLLAQTAVRIYRREMAARQQAAGT